MGDLIQTYFIPLAFTHGFVLGSLLHTVLSLHKMLSTKKSSAQEHKQSMETYRSTFLLACYIDLPDFQRFSPNVSRNESNKQHFPSYFPNFRYIRYRNYVSINCQSQLLRYSWIYLVLSYLVLLSYFIDNHSTNNF